MSFSKRAVGVACASTIGLFGVLAAFAQDNIEGPWGTKHGDMFRQARSDAIPTLFDANTPPVEVWRFSPNDPNVGGDRPGGWGSLVFDAAGNLYWRTTAGNNKMMSVDSAGNLRWIAHDPNGNENPLGPSANWNSTSPIVGQERVYTLGAGTPLIAAFDKATGVRLWRTPLPAEPTWTDNSQAGPVLYNGSLYVAGQSDGLDVRIYQVNASTGALTSLGIVPIAFPLSGTLTLVPDAFGNGLHGLYIQTDSGSGSDLFGEVYGIEINPLTSATLIWEDDGGHISTGRGGHIIYSPDTGHLYTHTWNDFGGSMYVFDPVTGRIASNMGECPGGPCPAGGHGFYDTASLGWDDASIVAGGFDGRIGVYREDPNGDPNGVTTTLLPYTPFFGEYRVVSQLLKNDANEPIFVSGTNSRCGDFNEPARAVALNLGKATAGPFEDGPAYIDDIEILQGADANSATPIFSEDFDSLSLGLLPGQAGWQDDRLAPAGGDPNDPNQAVEVIIDPTDPNGVNQVMELDALGTSGGWDGVFHDVAPDANGPVVVIQWRQWRPDRTDNIWPYFGDAVNDFGAAWTLGWDLTLKYFPYHFDDPNGTASVIQDKGVWETVQFTYDFFNFTVQLTITPDGGTPKVGTPISQFEFAIYGIGFQMEGTQVSENVNEPEVAYNTGICADHGFTTRGGVLTGPDGKMYYFHGVDRDLIALGIPACPADLDGDGDTDLDDLTILLQNYASGPGGDIDGDGDTDLDDLTVLLQNFGGACQ
jgi:hypothetical protein